jgi:hypothetical protein
MAELPGKGAPAVETTLLPFLIAEVSPEGVSASGFVELIRDVSRARRYGRVLTVKRVL